MYAFAVYRSAVICRHDTQLPSSPEQSRQLFLVLVLSPSPPPLHMPLAIQRRRRRRPLPQHVIVRFSRQYCIVVWIALLMD